jgi:hypothetical protein
MLNKKKATFLMCALMAGVLAGVQASAQDSGSSSPGADNQGTAPSKYSAEQLEQMVSPVALYPDSLLSQTLMAATYPIQVVECERWVEQNPGVKGDQLDSALAAKDWDPSVKSLASFPDVLKRLNEDLEWVQDLGTAFLNQQKDVMDAVQRMRQKAQQAGSLKTTGQQKIVVEKQVIEIQPADPQVIYVPAYNPTVIYGPDWYAPYWYYPAVMAPPPGWVAASNAMSFMAGVAVGSCMFGDFNWGGGNVYVNNNIFVNKRYYNNNVVYNRNNNYNNWQHNHNYPMPMRPGQGGSGEYHGNIRPGQGGSGEYHGDVRPGQGGSGEYHGDVRPGQGGSGEYHGDVRPGQGGSGEYRGWDASHGTGGNMREAHNKPTANRQNAFSGYTPGANEHRAAQRGAASRGGGAPKKGGGMPKGAGGGHRR